MTEGPQHVDVDSVLDTIEELRSAGAEAMQVNGKVRLVAQSSVAVARRRDSRSTGRWLTSPYVFDVIGDPHTLQGALSLFDGPIAQFKDAGATVDVQQEKALDITARPQGRRVRSSPSPTDHPPPCERARLPVACRASRAVADAHRRTEPREGEPCTPTT